MQGMQTVTLPVDPKLTISGIAQKIMVLKKLNYIEHPLEEAKIIYEENEQTIEARKQGMLLKPNDL